MATVLDRDRETVVIEDPTPKQVVQQWAWFGAAPGKLLQALVFGSVFGFLLQKGGVANFDILIGVLLLEEFTVVKVMVSAIVVGMLGTYALRRFGLLEPQIKATVYGANVIGGLVFGIGFALLAYCPGTDAAAVGQGNLDAIVGVFGLTFGSYLFALSSVFSRGGLTAWGQRGKITLPDVFGISHGLLIAIVVPLLIGALMLLEVLA
jgi:hypothetical protein